MGGPASVLPRNLRAERARAGMRQSDLASHLGVSQSAVSGWESASREVPVAMLAPLCRVLGCTLADLFRGADPADLATLGLDG